MSRRLLIAIAIALSLPCVAGDTTRFGWASHGLGGGLAHAQEPTPTPVDIQTAEAQASALLAQAASAQSAADAYYAQAADAARRESELRAQAEAQTAEAARLRLAGTQAAADAALAKVEELNRIAGERQLETQSALSNAAASLAQSRAALDAANTALSMLGSVSAELQTRRDELIVAQARLESLAAENADLKEVLRAERGVNTWLLGALLLLAVSAIAGIALVSRRRPVVERVLDPQVFVVQDTPRAPSPADLVPGGDGEPGVIHLRPEFAEQIMRRYSSRERIVEQP